MKQLSFITIRDMTEEEARETLEKIRWPNGVICPHCNNEGAYKVQSKKARPGVWKCKTCKKQFTVTVGSVFEGTRIPLRDWLMVINKMASSKKGISAHQISREFGITYKTAWFMCHRIREAKLQSPIQEKLKGVVEADETYVGGKFRGGKRGRGSENKTPVFALVERGGELRAWKVDKVTAKTLKIAIRDNVDKGSILMTDGFRAYRGLKNEYADHQVVEHGVGEYVREQAHVNTLEGWFAILKRGVTGTFHHVSSKHLHRYVGEFAFRYNKRKLTDAERTLELLRGAFGKRLIYKQVTKSPAG